MRRYALFCWTLLALMGLMPGIWASQDAGARFDDLVLREWKARLRENPLLATSVGVDEFNDRLPSMTFDDLQRRDVMWREFLAELQAIDASQLDEQERMGHRILQDQLQDRVAGFRFGAYQMPLNADSGFHTSFARLPFDVPLRTATDYDNYVARMKSFPRYVGEQIALMRMGMERGMTLPQVVLEGLDAGIAAHVVDDMEGSIFYEPFVSFPGSVPAAQHDRLRREGKQAIETGVVRGYQDFLKFMTGEYIPGARSTLGASELPDGRDYYAQRIRHFTTLDLSAREIDEIGLAEVKRIRNEMMEIITEVEFEGSFPEFLQFLRTDPRFYAKTAEELLKEASFISKRMDGKLPGLFGRLPRLPYTVEPVPEHIAPKYTAGRYVGAPVGSTQPGRYWVNTHALDTRPLYNLEALSLHEAVPGHHLQISLNQELENLPDFRRHSYLSAFGEGWGLYSEWLGLEAGFYTDPYSNFGRLTYEMWRACRLVVDTGVHAMGWTREQMMEYLASHTALSLHEITTETDRYISWPAQALAYKIGQLKILELRRRAEKELGEGFDVREFHDTVLRNGSIPLSVLEEVIETYLEEFPAAGQDKPFDVWLADLRKEALARKISPDTLDAALQGVEPLEKVIELDRSQPEFTMTFARYRERVVSDKRVATGKRMMREHRKLLQAIHKRYGVQPRFLVALWGIESRFGEQMGSYRVVEALATLAYDGRRSKFFRGELLDALQILEEGHIEPDRMLGSWAGAMGQVQFMPSSFHEYSVDFDGDARADLWGNTSDALASAANYLVRSGWKGDQTWGREVRLPKGFDGNLIGRKVTRTLPQWQGLGVRRPDGSALPDRALRASLVQPDGAGGSTYVAYDNYRALLRWNRSDFFALSVGLLSDALR